MVELQKGDIAPQFALQSDARQEVRLADFRGRRVVLYFYPADMTTGCTLQACELRDEFGAFRKVQVETLGVSPDSVASHARFRDLHALPFTLLSDPRGRVAQKYGVWVRKPPEYGGRMGNERTTFIISPDGYIEQVLRKVRPAEHRDQLLTALSNLAAAE